MQRIFPRRAGSTPQRLPRTDVDSQITIASSLKVSMRTGPGFLATRESFEIPPVSRANANPIHGVSCQCMAKKRCQPRGWPDEHRATARDLRGCGRGLGHRSQNDQTLLAAATEVAILHLPFCPTTVLQKVLQSPDVAENITKKKALNHCGVGLYVSAPHWTRTNNPLIKSQMLCQLS